MDLPEVWIYKYVPLPCTIFSINFLFSISECEDTENYVLAQAKTFIELHKMVADRPRTLQKDSWILHTHFYTSNQSGFESQ